MQEEEHEERLGGGGLPLHNFGNLKSNNGHKNAFIRDSYYIVVSYSFLMRGLGGTLALR
ncbi:unnamed protein product [Brassica oleracea var. botrytis]|uniref:(rape) hypothetical protein n=1 Tax=Brassica napus TaxID=3708 RepID=A0A816K8D1_BRANA|nr:unnamed protein product [Brassica napus]